MSTITITQPRTVRIMEQTASRDHDGVLVPGTYELKVKFDTDINGRPTDSIDYAWASVPAEVKARRQSSVEFGGVPLAFEEVPAQVEQYTLMIRGYQIDGWTLDQINL